MERAGVEEKEYEGQKRRRTRREEGGGEVTRKEMVRTKAAKKGEWRFQGHCDSERGCIQLKEY